MSDPKPAWRKQQDSTELEPWREPSELARWTEHRRSHQFIGRIIASIVTLTAWLAATAILVVDNYPAVGGIIDGVAITTFGVVLVLGIIWGAHRW